MRGSPSQNALTTSGPRPSFCVQDKQQGNTGSIGHIARRVPWDAFGHVAGIIVTIADIIITFDGAAITVVDHVARVRRNHHPIVIGSEGPDQRVHIVFQPSR